MIRAVLLLLLMMMACSQLPAGVPAFDVQAAWSQPVEQVQEQECSDANADEASETQATERPVVFDEQITVASYGTAGTATVDDDLAAVVQQEVSQLVWRKGDIRVTPYGILWTDAILSTNRTFPGNFILYAESSATQGENTFEIDARRSRVGIDIAGPTSDYLGGVTSAGKVEIDFLGGFVNPNTTDLRLRHAYWEATNDEYRLLVGQTWDVVSPLRPNTVNFSVNWAAGNIGFRRTQFRSERTLALDSGNVVVQSAIAQTIVPDLTGGTLAAGVVRESGGWPMLQGRVAWTQATHASSQDPIAVGFSGHLGETGFDFTQTGPGPAQLPPQLDARIRSWSANADWIVPLSKRARVTGEFFVGENLSNLLGGINQGVCPCLRTPIGSTGGWIELAYDWTPDLHSHVGFGIDDPNNQDSLIGRSRNQVIYTNLFVDLTRHLKTGLEVSVWETQYHNLTLNDPNPALWIDGPTTPGEAVTVDLTVQYHF